MKFQEGDKVIIQSTGEKGEVIEWINKKMLTIEVDGVQFPVYADQLDFPYYSDFTSPVKLDKKSIEKKNVLPKTEANIPKTVVNDGTWLSFFPVLDKDVFDEDVISHFRIYLLNHTEHDFQVSFMLYYAGKKQLDLRHHTRAQEELYLFDLPFENLNDQPVFQFDFAVSEKLEWGNQVVELKPKAKQIFKMAETILSEQKASFRLQLFSAFDGKLPIRSSEPMTEKENGMDLSGLSRAGFKVTHSKSK